MRNLINREKALLFRVTHVNNIPWIFDNGLHCANSSVKDPEFVTIGNENLITRRKHREVPIHPYGTLADYIPFYFTPFSIMMYQIITGHAGIQERSEPELVILTASARDLVSCGLDVVFTDRHAYSRTAKHFSSLDELKRVDWDLLQNRDFRNDPDDPGKKERYQAEALIFEHMPVTYLKGIVCRTESTKRALEHLREQAGVEVRIASHPGWYFHGISQGG